MVINTLTKWDDYPPALKLTVCTWKWMVGRWNFPWGWPIFRGELFVWGGSVAAADKFKAISWGEWIPSELPSRFLQLSIIIGTWRYPPKMPPPAKKGLTEGFFISTMIPPWFPLGEYPYRFPDQLPRRNFAERHLTRTVKSWRSAHDHMVSLLLAQGGDWFSLFFIQEIVTEDKQTERTQQQTQGEDSEVRWILVQRGKSFTST